MCFKSLFALYTAIFIHFQSFSQISKYDSIYLHTSQVLVGDNPNQALKNVADLYAISNNNKERIKACILKATLLRQYNLNEDAITVLLKADSIAVLDNDFFMIARINGFLSTIYRETGVFSVGSTFLKKAINASSNIENKEEMYRFQANLCQELAYYKVNERNYSAANEQLFKSNQLFSKIDLDVNKPFHYAVNSEMIAKNYFSLQKIDSALFFFKKAQQQLSISQSPKSPLQGFIFNGLGNVYSLISDYKNADFNYARAEEVAEESDFYNLRYELYNSLLKYYKKINNTEKYIHYNDLYLKLIQKDDKDRKIITDNLISTLHAEQKQDYLEYKQIYLLIICVGFAIVTLLFLIYVYKRKQDHKKIKDFILNYDHSNLIKDDTKTVNEYGTTVIKVKETTKNYMSVETEQAILKSIDEFELSKYYLDNNISMNFVASELGTNHRYLSYVINKYKKKDFNSYINELRIKYIIERLREDVNFRKYKISYLAEQCGFSSHSRFTITFKKITGVSPLAFINYLKENEKAN